MEERSLAVMWKGTPRGEERSVEVMGIPAPQPSSRARRGAELDSGEGGGDKRSRR